MNTVALQEKTLQCYEWKHIEFEMWNYRTEIDCTVLISMAFYAQFSLVVYVFEIFECESLLY